MEKTLWVVFCVWLFFEGGEPFGKICQGHKQNFFDKFISSPFLSWLALVFYPCMFPLYLAWNVSLRCILFFQYPLLTVYVVVLLLLFFLLPCVLLSVFKQRKKQQTFLIYCFRVSFYWIVSLASQKYPTCNTLLFYRHIQSKDSLNNFFHFLNFWLLSKE